MAVWIKADGTELEVNDTDASIEQATKLGWELKALEKKAKKTKKEKTKKEVIK